MDGSPQPITPQNLYGRLGTAAAPLLFDVRRPEGFAADDKLIIGSLYRAPADGGWLTCRWAIRWPQLAGRDAQWPATKPVHQAAGAAAA